MKAPHFPNPARFRLQFLPVFLLFLALVPPLSLTASEWHVSGQGDDRNSGTTPATAFRTLKQAAAHIQPGDTVIVGDGIYTDPTTASGSAVLTIDHRGGPDAWTTFKAAPGAQPEIRPSGWHGILITGTYVIIDGLKVTGANEAITLRDALTDGLLKEKDGKRYFGDPRYNTNGISIEGRKSPPDRKPHHIIIRNCVISKLAGGGITFLETDHFTVEDCLVFDNSWFTRYAASGITSLNNWAHDDAPGYHVVIRRNLVWGNKTLVPWTATGKLSDGNGILLDVTENKASGGAANPTGETASFDPNAASLNPERPAWKHRALIANNVSAFNGGSGIHTFRTAHVDIVNNTTYWNGAIVGYEELFPNRSEDVVILNNVIVPRPGGRVTSNNRNTNIRWDYNLYPAPQKDLQGANDIIGDPSFIRVRPDLREADFRLQAASPGRDSGNDDDLDQPALKARPRPVGKGRDRGAYEQ